MTQCGAFDQGWAASEGGKSRKWPKIRVNSGSARLGSRVGHVRDDCMVRKTAFTHAHMRITETGMGSSNSLWAEHHSAGYMPRQQVSNKCHAHGSNCCTMSQHKSTPSLRDGGLS